MSCLIERRAVEAAAVAGALGALLGSPPADRGLLGGILAGTAAGGMLLTLRLPPPSKLRHRLRHTDYRASLR